MKLKLPHETVELDMNLEIQERKTIIEELLLKKVPVDSSGTDGELISKEITLEEYFTITWDKPNTKIMLDIIGYYLTKEKKQLEVLSVNKQMEMQKGSKRHTTFTSMGYDNQVTFGLVDPEDYTH